jgi:DNA polymerase
MGRFLPNAKISDIHGQAMNVRGRLIVAMFHPAAALHQKSLKTTIEQDFSRLPQLIAKATRMPEYQEPVPEEKKEGKQLSLF